MKMRTLMIWVFMLCELIALLALPIGSTGCADSDIAVPYDAPLMISQDETLHNPYAREHGQWVKKQGTVTRHQGAVVLLLPATQPVSK